MTLTIGIVGTGKVAQNYLAAMAEQQAIHLCYYNRTRAKAEAAAEHFGGTVVGSLADLMALTPDSVLVLTAETVRHTIAHELLDHSPKRLFFEKPLVAQQGQAAVTEADFAQAHQLLQRAATVGTETAMVFNYRFFAQTQKARQLIAERDLGAPVHFTALVHYACWSHCIDLLHWFMGGPETITAVATAEPGPCMGSDNVHNVSAAVRLSNGATGTIIGTCGIDFNLPLYELTLCFERGRITMRDLDGDLEFIDYASGRHTVHALSRNVSRWDQYRASFANAINAYLDTVRQGTPPPVPGLAGLQELQFEAALKRSLATERPVAVQRAFPIQLSATPSPR